MPVTTPRELTTGIEQLGNSLALLFSDRTSLQYIREMFSGTIVEVVANVLAAKQNDNFDSVAIEIKACLVANCLRGTQFAIYADDVVEESELDNVYPIIKPLASFYQQYLGGRYARFENLQRSGVFDFLHTHMTDSDFFGGRITQTKAFYKGKYLTPTDSLALQGERAGVCLSAAGTILTKDNLGELFFELIGYPISVILSDGRGHSLEYLEGRTCQLEGDRLKCWLDSLMALIDTIRSRYQRAIQERGQFDVAGKTAHIENLWKRNRSSMPTTSHFHDSWFAGSSLVPTSLTGNVVPSPGVAPLAMQGGQSSEDVLQAALDELNDLEGLASVKKEVNNLVAFLKIQRQRAEQGMKTSSQALHYVFHGNPGTGKTTVARILAKVFYGFGILKSQCAAFLRTCAKGRNTLFRRKHLLTRVSCFAFPTAKRTSTSAMPGSFATSMKTRR